MSRLTLALLGALRLATAASTFLSGFYTGHDVLSSSLEQLVLPSLAPGNVEAPQLHANVEVLAPGLVIIRGAISAEDQQILASSAHRLGKRRDGGFLNAAEGRGRIYDKATRLPGCFRRLCGKAVVAARASDDAMPSMTPSHVLVNKYTSSKGLLWHRDIYDNDGDGEHPIVNLSVGATCEFGVEIPVMGFFGRPVGLFGRRRTVRLESGDALLFGGPCRYIKHTVKRVLLHDTPSWMPAEEPSYRLSFTFRQAPSVLGQERKYRTFDVGRKWFAQTQRAWRPGQPLVACA